MPACLSPHSSSSANRQSPSTGLAQAQAASPVQGHSQLLSAWTSAPNPPHTSSGRKRNTGTQLSFPSHPEDMPFKGFTPNSFRESRGRNKSIPHEGLRNVSDLYRVLQSWPLGYCLWASGLHFST